MLKKHFSNLIVSKLGEQPTKGQQELIGSLSDFITNISEKEIFVVKGYAGTGKTSLIAAVVNVLNEFKIKTTLLAPTGRAAKVLSNFAGVPASTIHKRIYQQRSSKDGFGKFVLARNLSSDTIFIVDEASMIGNQNQDASIFGSGNLLNDLIEYVYNDKRCKLVLIGDSAQLPPVGADVSPALKNSELQMYCHQVKDYTLTEVVRQTSDSGILFNATQLRQQIAENNFTLPNFNVTDYKDVVRLNGVDLIEELNVSFDKYGIEETVVVCRSNKRANKYNEGIRQQILFREEQISRGDFLMVVKNNYHWLADDEDADFIANGDIVEIVKIKSYQERYGFHFADVVLRLPDHDNMEITSKILLETLDIEGAALNSEDNKKLFYNVYEDFKDLTPKKKGYDMVREDPFFNALQVKFAYAITCHKAQGGQWKSVFIDQGYFTEDMLNLEFLRWLYTAFTRATEKVYLVNFNKEFYGEH